MWFLQEDLAQCKSLNNTGSSSEIDIEIENDFEIEIERKEWLK